MRPPLEDPQCKGRALESKELLKLRLVEENLVEGYCEGNLLNRDDAEEDDDGFEVRSRVMVGVDEGANDVVGKKNGGLALEASEV